MDIQRREAILVGELKRHNARRYANKRKPLKRHLEVGDKVLYRKTRNRRNKLKQKYVGPVEILKAYGNKVYLIKDPETNRTKRVHMDELFHEGDC